MTDAVASIAANVTNKLTTKVKQQFQQFAQDVKAELAFAIISKGVGLIQAGESKILLSVNRSELDGQGPAHLAVLHEPIFSWHLDALPGESYRLACIAMYKERKGILPAFACPKVALLQLDYAVSFAAVEAFLADGIVRPSDGPLVLTIVPKVADVKRIKNQLQSNEKILGGARLLTAKELLVE